MSFQIISFPRKLARNAILDYFLSRLSPSINHSGYLTPKLSWTFLRQMISFRQSMRKYDLRPGLPDFSWCMVPKSEKIYQMDTICTYQIRCKNQLTYIGSKNSTHNNLHAFFMLKLQTYFILEL
jgi:hypothetical protein